MTHALASLNPVYQVFFLTKAFMDGDVDKKKKMSKKKFVEFMGMLRFPTDGPGENPRMFSPLTMRGPVLTQPVVQQWFAAFNSAKTKGTARTDPVAGFIHKLGGNGKEGRVGLLMELMHSGVDDAAVLAGHRQQLLGKKVTELRALLQQQQHRAAIITKYKLTTFL